MYNITYKIPSFNKDKINLAFDVNNYAVDKNLTKKNIKKVDGSANAKIIFNKTISIVEGSALGILGIGLPDIPIFIGFLLKNIYEIVIRKVNALIYTNLNAKKLNFF